MKRLKYRREGTIMNNKITQGSIISYTRSLNYPNLKCMGIIISARCDLANKGKIKNMHWLTAITLEEWIYEVEFYRLIDQKEAELLNSIKTIIQPYDLNIDIIKNWGPDISKELFNKYDFKMKSKKKNELIEKCNQWKKYKDVVEKSLSIQEKKRVLKDEKINLKKILSDLQNGANRKYCFIPEKAYNCNTNSSVNGIIVDIYDIHQVPILYKEKIENGVYDYQVINNSKEREELNRHFYFQDSEDYIINIYEITSPWIEYLMQHFSHAFSRIGVDNASSEEIEIYCDKIMKG